MAARRFDLEERLVEFAARVCALADRLPPRSAGKHIAAQLIRSGSSPLANYGEAQGAESRQDFVHKLRLCLKELRETRAWLKLVDRLALVTEDSDATRRECDELIAIFVVSIRTARSKCRMSNVQ